MRVVLKRQDVGDTAYRGGAHSGAEGLITLKPPGLGIRMLPGQVRGSVEVTGVPRSGR